MFLSGCCQWEIYKTAELFSNGRSFGGLVEKILPGSGTSGSDMFRIWANISLKCISYTVVKTGLRGSQTNCPLFLSPRELKETLQIYLDGLKVL
jgi:hypothetical protein